MSLQLSTTGFANQGAIPEKFSKSGGNISPPLSWSGAPEGTRTLALIVDDPDAPSGTFVHWLVYGIPPKSTGLKEDRPARNKLSDGSCQGRNGFGEIGYGGPQPPAGTHRYFFHLYALDRELELDPGVKREELDRAMEGHILEQAEISGTFAHREPAARGA